MTVAGMLAEFHAAVSHPETDALWTRITLHREEHEELVEALKVLHEDEQRNFLEPPRMADREAVARELADVVYVAYGTAHALGIDLEAALAEVHRANMSKADGPRRADGKVLKPEGFVPPDMSAACGHSRRAGVMSATLLVSDWHCECSCGYGRGGWPSSPAFQGKPILDQDSTECPGCGETFTARRLGPEARRPAPRYKGDFDLIGYRRRGEA